MGTKAKGPPCGQTTSSGGKCARPVGEDGTCGINHARERMSSMRMVDVPRPLRRLLARYAHTDPISGQPADPAPRSGRRRRRGGLTRRAARTGGRKAAQSTATLATEPASKVARPDRAYDDLSS